MTRRDRTEKPPGAWRPDQVVDMLVDGVSRGDFHILCLDSEVTRAVDQRRTLWAAGDIVENRPALSRWHPEYGEAFARFSGEARDWAAFGNKGPSAMAIEHPTPRPARLSSTASSPTRDPPRWLETAAASAAAAAGS